MLNFNLPHRTNIRLQNWNYAWKGLYFVTINTKFGVPYFGEIANNIVQLSDIGKEVEKQWLMTPSIRPDMNLLIDEYVVMPNHFHGIIGIGENQYNSRSNCMASMHRNRMASMHAGHTSLPAGGIFGPQRKNLGSTIRGFKSSVTTWCKHQPVLFEWHSGYFDIIIRNEIMLDKIRNYIRNNPKNWGMDRFHATM